MSHDRGTPPPPGSYLLHSEETLADLAQAAIAHARSLGADEVMAAASEGAGMSLRASGGRIESARRDGAQSLAVSVYDGGRTGRASTQALDLAAIRRTVEQAVTIARQVQPDDSSGLADAEWIARDPVQIPLFAPAGLTGDTLAETALEIEAAALAAAGGVTVRVVDAAASSHESRWARATSHGFCGVGSATSNARWCVAIAERDGAMARDYWQSSDRRAGRVDAAALIGGEAARRAQAKLGGAGLSTRRTAVLFDRRLAPSLLADLAGTLNGMAQYQGRTFLPDPLGKDVLAAHLSVSEDPFEAYGLASSAFDSDCIAPSRRAIVADGMVAGLFVGATAARKLGTRPTGNADGPTNLTLVSSLTAPGDTLPTMLRRMGTGLWVTEFIGGGVNPVTGAYSKAASGFWIENGEIVRPVQDLTIASDLRRMLAGIVAVGADCYREGAFRSGSVLIDEMQIAGR